MKINDVENDYKNVDNDDHVDNVKKRDYIEDDEKDINDDQENY